MAFMEREITAGTGPRTDGVAGYGGAGRFPFG
jgi:hypothetical protein